MKSGNEISVEKFIHRVWLFKGTMRRFFMVRFRKKYVEEQLEKRRGQCLQCGRCCEMSFKCLLLKKNNDGIFCRIYMRGRPLSCTLFPINERDLADVGNNCGYYFEN